MFAIGKPSDGAALFDQAGQLILTRAEGKGFVADPPIAADRVAIALEPSGRALMAWGDMEGRLRGTTLRGGRAPTYVELGSGAAASACLTATHGWVAGAGQFIRFDELGAAPHMLTDHVLVACTDVAMLAQQPDTTTYAV